MTRIGATLSGIDLSARKNLSRALDGVNQASVRLATQQRINRGSDDPAGLIASQRLRSELVSLERAQANTSRASAVVDVADAGLSQISEQLNTITQSVLAAAGGGLSAAERAAHQVQIDSALGAINRVANTTSLGGQQLLDGSAGTLTFSIGPAPDDTADVALPDARTSSLGGLAGALGDLASGGSASLASGNFAQASEIVSQARDQVGTARGTLGAFARNTLDTAERSLSAARTSVSAAFSEITDADVAETAASLVRSEIVAAAALKTLGQVNQRRGLLVSLLQNDRR